MKKQHILSICIAGALLTACGSGSDGGGTSINKGNSNTHTNPTNGKLPYPHKVPTELQQAVKNALKIPVYWNPALGDKVSVTMGDKSYQNGDNVDLTDFDLGLTQTNFTDSQDEGYSSKGNVKIYRQNYSAIMAFLPTEGKLASNNDIEKETEEVVSISRPIGYVTKNMPETGKATYKGKSFYQTEEGNFNLAVNFGDNKVSGEITGLSVGKVTLKETGFGETTYEPLGKDTKEEKAFGYKGIATLSNGKQFTVKMATTTKNGVESVTDEKFTSDKYEFEYMGGFFGPNAEETVGKIWARNKTDQNEDLNFTDIVGFAGQRGKIEK